MSDLISRADAIEAVRKVREKPEKYYTQYNAGVDCSIKALSALPSADADNDDLIIKGAKGIQDGLYNIKDGKLFKYKAKGGTVRTYEIVPSAEAVQGWIPCSERLPNVGENVLFTTDIYGGYVAEGDRRADGKWWQYRWNSLLQNDDVIAWMPLPKPYREDGEEE